MLFRYQSRENVRAITVLSDTGFAECRETRKSTCGGVLIIGSHLVRTWSSTQSVIALSSGEVAAPDIGAKAIVKDLGVNEDKIITVKSDASAAIGIAQSVAWVKFDISRLTVSQLWLQERVANGTIKINKTRTYENSADQPTKPVSAEKMRYNIEMTH